MNLNHFFPPVESYEPISIATIQDMLQTSRGAKFITIITRTKPPVNKDCPYPDVVKLSRVNGVVNFHYGEAVKRQQVREGQLPDFEPSKRSWGTRLSNSPFVAHIKDGQSKLYLELKIEKSLGHAYYDGDRAINEEDMKSFLRERKHSGQPVEKEVILRDYDMDNVLAITIDGMGYVISR